MKKIFEVSEYVVDFGTDITYLKIGTDEVSILLNILDLEYNSLVHRTPPKPERQNFSREEDFLIELYQHEDWFADVPSRSDFIIEKIGNGEVKIREISEIDGHTVVVC